MGNIITSIISGFARAVGDFFGAPIDFLSGKSCSSKCGSTWDFLCYIENFCIGNLLKLLAVSIFSYAVMLFFYLLYKVGICHCVCTNTWKMIWACLASCFSSCEYGCMFVWFRLRRMKEMKRRNKLAMDMRDSTWDDEDFEERISFSHRHGSSGSGRSWSQSRRFGENRRWRMERSLRPRSHRIRVGISRRLVYVNERSEPRKRRHGGALQNIRVTHTSKFVQKANGRRVHHRSRLL